ncbi:hypothetical protein ACX0FD_15070, partial [Enterococcus faecium]|nr:hypothetical protein [Enterococcus faecium]
IVIPPAIFFYYSTLFDSRFKTLQQNQYKYSYQEFVKRRKQFQQRVVTQRSLRQLNRTINAHEEKYHASKAYEEQQRRIQMEQERQ